VLNICSGPIDVTSTITAEVLDSVADSEVSVFLKRYRKSDFHYFFICTAYSTDFLSCFDSHIKLLGL
jgi:hypothetical protein